MRSDLSEVTQPRAGRAVAQTGICFLVQRLPSDGGHQSGTAAHSNTSTCTGAFSPLQPCRQNPPRFLFASWGARFNELTPQLGKGPHEDGSVSSQNLD